MKRCVTGVTNERWLPIFLEIVDCEIVRSDTRSQLLGDWVVRLTVDILAVFCRQNGTGAKMVEVESDRTLQEREVRIQPGKRTIAMHCGIVCKV